MAEEEHGTNSIPTAKLDARWFKTYQSIVSFDLFTWLAIAGPFTEEEQREWDHLFGRDDDEARKRMATMMATSRDRELGLALEEQQEPRLRYPACGIPELVTLVQSLVSLVDKFSDADDGIHPITLVHSCSRTH